MKYYGQTVTVLQRIGYFFEELGELVWGLRWVIVSVVAIIAYGLAS